MESNFASMVTPLMYPEVPINRNRQPYQQQWHFEALQQPGWGREEENHTFISPEPSSSVGILQQTQVDLRPILTLLAKFFCISHFQAELYMKNIREVHFVSVVTRKAK